MISVGLSGRIAHYFINNRLTLLFVITALLAGVFAVLMTPREEEPQIQVPMVDIFLPMPGSSPQEVEQRVAGPLEKLLWEIPGVEYVYSTSMSDMGMVIVRYKVGTNPDAALLKIYDKVVGNWNRMPQGAMMPLIKLHGIDDVPVLALSLWGKGYDAFTLTRLGRELEAQLRAVPDVAQVEVVGAQEREVRVVLDPVRMSAHSVSPLGIAQSLQAFNSRLPSGSLVKDGKEIRLEVGSWLKSKEDVASVLVGFAAGKPLYLGDVAAIEDGPPLPDQYVLFGVGPAAKREAFTAETQRAQRKEESGGKEGQEKKNSASSAPLRSDFRAVPADAQGQYPAVTVSVAKRPGTNASALNELLLHKMEGLRGTLLPADLNITVTRDYGETAAEKSNELIKHLILATLAVVILIGFMLGWKESIVVGIAVPVTLAFTLLIYYLSGYTLNRVTLFALIFSIGILVDDAIVVVENMYRHFTMKDGRTPMRKAIEAVDEVGNPTILATFTVIAAILPMAFVRGMMGPYMRPIPVGASAAMLISLVVAFMVSPWAAYRLLKNKVHAHEEGEMKLLRVYRRFMNPLTHDAKKGALFLLVTVLLLVGSISLVVFKVVKVKMLPFDNKSEFQVMVDMPEGTPLEESLRAAQQLAQKLTGMKEVTNYQIYAGTSAPITFNGLVRHYYLRHQPHAADIQVNLLPKGSRSKQSHDLAKLARELLKPEADRLGVKLKVVEVPPGPPVLSTLVSEIYGPTAEGRMQVAKDVLALYNQTAGVVDADLYAVDPQPLTDLRVDPKKVAAAGLSVMEVSNAVSMAVRGAPVGLVHMERERENVPVTLRMPREFRSDLASLASLQIQNRQGTMIPLSTLVYPVPGTIPQEIYHKNLQPVTYAVAEVAGAIESPAYAMFKLNGLLDKLKLPDGTVGLKRLYSEDPLFTDTYSMKWDGEWQVTYEVFRDLGVAFALVLVLMYILVVGWFKSYLTPLAIMAPIPLSLVGVIPAHGLMGAFFTATSMIGFIALAGIVVRNSILVIDFAEMKMRQGMPLKDAVVEGGAVRFRAMLLTALAVVVGSSVMLFDPIFQGMAIALMAGTIASTLLSWGAIPILYVWFYGDKPPVTDEDFSEEEK
jgi:multidrug efflux pump subunit AcrB